MDSDDEMIVVIVENEEEEHKESEQIETYDIKVEPLDEEELENLMETAKKYGQRLDITKNGEEEEFQLKYELLQDIKVEQTDDYTPEDYAPDEDYVPDDDDYVPDEQDDDSDSSDGEKYDVMNVMKRSSITPAQRKSFVQELRQEYPELRKNEKALVKTLSEIMRSVKRPTPPRDYFIMNDILFECRKCGTMSETIQASARHFQEKHGKRYLVCYACGVDFRSTTNLYKHEKRCMAPDAVIVLKARALCLGRKGRSRPFIPDPKDCVLRAPVSKRHHCSKCPAKFTAKVHLEAHENLHLGLRPYRCHECPCAYTSVARLRRHMKNHSNEQFICDDCGRPFKVKAALVVHMNTHMPEPQFPCSQCPRRYATKHALQNHVRREHDKLPPACACPICPVGYPRMSLVRDHMLKKHGMSLMTRKMFFKALPTMSDDKLKQALELIKSSDTMYYYVDQDTVK